jgi:DNA-binding IclR family transcriptional regulator
MCALSVSGPETRVKPGDARRLAQILAPIAERFAASLAPPAETD